MHNQPKTIQHDPTKAAKVLELSQYIRGVKAKRKAICAAFTEETKRVEKELADILSDEPTTLETINNIQTEHDIKFIE